MTDGPEDTGQQQVCGNEHTRFKPGQSGNPHGRKKGSRNKLSEAFIQSLCEDFEKNGKEVIERVRTERPQDYLKVVAGLQPKEVNLNNPLSELSDDELTELISAVRWLLSSSAPGGTGSGEEAPQRH